MCHSLIKREANRVFPGDELVAHPQSQFTHAVEINAPIEAVWPWVAQIGQGRGGFYSYEALENITGMNIYNSDEVLPEFQDPEIGDIIPFSPEDGYPLVICESGRSMAIETCFDLDDNVLYDPALASPENYFHLTWLWHIEPTTEHRSRFFSRNRLEYSKSIKNKVIFGLLMEPIVFAMDRKMCLGIKRRAEKLFHKSLFNAPKKE